jgi:hypothetical protein
MIELKTKPIQNAAVRLHRGRLRVMHAGVLRYAARACFQYQLFQRAKSFADLCTTVPKFVPSGCLFVFISRQVLENPAITSQSVNVN